MEENIICKNGVVYDAETYEWVRMNKMVQDELHQNRGSLLDDCDYYDWE